jgi:hypothetical protein
MNAPRAREETMPQSNRPSWLEKRPRERSAAKPLRPPLRSFPELPLRHQLALPIVVRLGRLDGPPPRRGTIRHKPRSLHVDWQLMYAMRERVRAAGCDDMLARVVALATGADAPSEAEIGELAYLLAKLIATSRL